MIFLSYYLLHATSTDVEDLSWYYVTSRGWRDYPYAGDFDVRYNGRQTTYKNYGWWPVFKVDNSNIQRIKGIRGGKECIGKICVSTEITKPLGNNYLLITFVANNTDDDPHYISIASHTDVMITGNDDATVEWYGEALSKRGLTMTDNRYTHATLTLITRNGYQVTDVDTFWFGQWEYNDQHYWDNRNDKNNLYGKDSAFSFGWKNRQIYPGDVQRYSVLLGIGRELKNTPEITINDNFRENYLPGAKVKITGSVNDIDVGETITVKYNFSNGANSAVNKVVNTFPSGSRHEFSFEVTLGEAVDAYKLQVWAEDSFDMKSTVYEKDLLVNEAPILTITNQILNKYFMGGVVDVQGRVWDDTYVYITYSFDNTFNFNTDQQVVCNRGEIPFRKTFQLREKNLAYGPHTLSIWATDQFGIKSKIYNYSFDYVELHTPEIQLDPVDEMKLAYQGAVAITGKIRDRDVGDILSLFVKYPDTDPTEPFILFDTYVSTGDWMPFTVYYFANKLTPGNKSITFQVRDQFNANSKDAVLYFQYIKLPVPTAQPSPSPIVIPEIPSNYTGPTTTNTTESWTLTNTTDINGDDSTTWTITFTQITIITDVIPPTPFATPAATVDNQDNALNGNVVPKNQNSSNINKYIIIGAAAAVAAATIIAAVIIIREAVKPAREFDFESEYPDGMDNMDNNDVEIENVNPIYDENVVDDPFADEFENDSEQDAFMVAPK